MRKNILTVAAVLVIFFLGFTALNSGDKTAEKDDLKIDSESGEVLTALIHKSPTCGCCGVFATYMQREGYNVEINSVTDSELGQVKHDLGVPHELGSCHTTEIAGYVIEGHIPNEAIEKLLSLKPDIKGIGMAGMPAGSPGMPGPKTGDFVIYEINHDATAGEIFMTI